MIAKQVEIHPGVNIPDPKDTGSDSDSSLSSISDAPKPKKARVGSKTSSLKRNSFRLKWTTAMKRHWNTNLKCKAMAAITIKRCDIATVK